MSRAFVKDDDPTGGAAVLSDRPISPYPNLVTRRGRQLIEARVAEFAHQSAGMADNPDAQARATRELRYWTARLASARVEPPQAILSSARFGTTVICVDASGQEVRFTIVGEDEAEPNAGRIAWTSPVARALLGGEPGDLRQLPKGEVEIVAIEPIEE